MLEFLLVFIGFFFRYFTTFFCKKCFKIGDNFRVPKKKLKNLNLKIEFKNVHKNFIGCRPFGLILLLIVCCYFPSILTSSNKILLASYKLHKLFIGFSVFSKIIWKCFHYRFIFVPITADRFSSDEK